MLSEFIVWCRFFRLTWILVLSGFGYGPRDSQLLSAPPYIAAVIFGMIVGFTADKVRMRGPFIILGACLSGTGSAILAFSGPVGV